MKHTSRISLRKALLAATACCFLTTANAHAQMAVVDGPLTTAFTAFKAADAAAQAAILYALTGGNLNTSVVDTINDMSDSLYWALNDLGEQNYSTMITKDGFDKAREEQRITGNAVAARMSTLQGCAAATTAILKGRASDATSATSTPSILTATQTAYMQDFTNQSAVTQKGSQAYTAAKGKAAANAMSKDNITKAMNGDTSALRNMAIAGANERMVFSAYAQGKLTYNDIKDFAAAKQQNFFGDAGNPKPPIAVADMSPGQIATWASILGREERLAVPREVVGDNIAKQFPSTANYSTAMNMGGKSIKQADLDKLFLTTDEISKGQHITLLSAEQLQIVQSKYNSGEIGTVDADRQGMSTEDLQRETMRQTAQQYDVSLSIDKHLSRIEMILSAIQAKQDPRIDFSAADIKVQ